MPTCISASSHTSDEGEPAHKGREARAVQEGESHGSGRSGSRAVEALKVEALNRSFVCCLTMWPTPVVLSDNDSSALSQLQGGPSRASTLIGAAGGRRGLEAAQQSRSSSSSAARLPQGGSRRRSAGAGPRGTPRGSCGTPAGGSGPADRTDIIERTRLLGRVCLSWSSRAEQQNTTMHSGGQQRGKDAAVCLWRTMARAPSS